jgi:hypothetical protein
MPSSGMLHRVALEITDVSEEHTNSIIRVTKIGELLFLRSVFRLLVTVDVVLSSTILVTLMIQAIRSSESRFLEEPRGVTSQKTAFSIDTAVRTSNLKKMFMVSERGR